MKKLILPLLLISYSTVFSQQKLNQAHLFFYQDGDEKCLVEQEGRGKVSAEKYKKIENTKSIIFIICGERFSFNKSNGAKKLHLQMDSKIKYDNIDCLVTKSNNSKKFKHNIFKKVYIYEQTSKSELIRYEVLWEDENFIID